MQKKIASLLMLLAGGAMAANQNKVSYQAFEIDSPLVDILWCGKGNDVIFVQTQFGTIYKSKDKGDSWKKLHSLMHQVALGIAADSQVSNHRHHYRQPSLTIIIL